ncbi:Uncharacterised protein [Mycobacterium tuberculosis]|nr:Uncharacterised protein [Mycobacterium tuberculosis]
MRTRRSPVSSTSESLRISSTSLPSFCATVARNFALMS